MTIVGNKYEIINSWNGNDGKIVTVTGYAGKTLDGCSTLTGHRWFIDCRVETNFGVLINHMGEKQLKAIDEDDRNKVISWEEMEGLWVPDDVCA